MKTLRIGMNLILLLLVTKTFAADSEAGLFQWKKGQILTYQVNHSTQALEIISDAKTEFKNQLELTKRWKVEEVAKDGMATLSLHLEAIKIQTTTPKGDVISFDSSKPKEGTPQLKEQMEKYIGPRIAMIVVDNQGRVRSVKESNFGSASKYEMELPFGLVVPPGQIQKGTQWIRPYHITVEPPQGTGEKIDSNQKYECLAISGSKATIKVSTELKQPPTAAADLFPLLPFLVEGEVTLDTSKGVVLETTLKTDKTLKGHQGENSSYQFLSVFKESLVGSK